jgi:hypothetical protein
MTASKFIRCNSWQQAWEIITRIEQPGKITKFDNAIYQMNTTWLTLPQERKIEILNQATEFTGLPTQLISSRAKAKEEKEIVSRYKITLFQSINK